jgi:LDH2 family malate/lactate/ureidoglycolate dehydrogenase
MATTTVALGKVEIQSRKDKTIPHGWGVDSEGKETDSPKDVLDGGGLLYLGGAEESGGYKGYGLGMMVDIMGGMLGGGAYAHHVRKWKAADGRHANLVSTIIIIIISCPCDDFEFILI